MSFVCAIVHTYVRRGKKVSSHWTVGWWGIEELSISLHDLFEIYVVVLCVSVNCGRIT